jgi:hypothetical protein
MNSHTINALRMLGEPSISEVEETIVDALTDLIHLCVALDLDWERMTDQAEWHFDQYESHGIKE